MGEWTRPYMRICTEAVHRCVPGSQLIVIPRASHSASAQNPDAFNAAMLNFLATN
jgi:pimeloyl-ACP methyl ester carboxylesterase